MIKLTLKKPPTVTLEAETICPDRFVDLSNQQIAELTVFHGKRQHCLGDYFDIDGEQSDEVEITGDLHRVRMIGQRMSRGRLTIVGNVGMHLGAYLSGGNIEVHGNVDDWLGAEMTGGEIRVHGNAGGQVGAAYRGSLSGMSDGTIVIDGSAGIEVGMRMKRGTIVIGERVRDFCGLQMKGGTIILLGGAEIRTGAWMTRGTIISLEPLQMMPTFLPSADYNPTFINVYARDLGNRFGVHLPYAADGGSYTRYCGDKAVPGKGEVLVWNAK